MTTPIDPKEQKIVILERQLETARQQLAELARRISFLERENNRRRQDVNTLARKG